jgi:hypothetical protein
LEFAKEQSGRYKSQRDETILILEKYGGDIESLMKRFDEQSKVLVHDGLPRKDEGKDGDIWFEILKKGVSSRIS